jgi:transposase
MEEGMNAERVSYAGKRVYIGIDVHRAFFVASCVCDGVVVRRVRMPPKSEAVISLIRKYFPDSEVRTCYESGLRGIRIPSVEQEHERLLTRTREQLMRAKRRAQIQIRMRLHQFGLFPGHIERVIRLKDVDALLEKVDGDLHFTISCLRAEWERLAVQVKEIDRKLLERSKQSPLDEIYRSVPGIGPLIARVLSSELGDLSQFPNERALFSFTGLTPGEYSSGNNVHRGSISRQGSSRLRHMLVEAAWKAIRKDKVLREFFERVAKKAGKKRAIVAVARKLVGRIRAAVRASTCYEVGHKAAA